MKENDSRVIGLLAVGFLIMLAETYVVTQQIDLEPIRMAQGEVVEIGRDICISENGIGHQGSLNVAILRARCMSGKDDPRESYEILMDGVEVVLPQDETGFKRRAEEQVFSAIERRAVRSEKVKPLPRVSGCQLTDLRVARADTNGVISPWFMGKRADIGSEGLRIFGCEEQIVEKTIYYPCADLQYNPTLRLVPCSCTKRTKAPVAVKAKRENGVELPHEKADYQPFGWRAHSRHDSAVR